jgi:SAM-dependent methyltransferase
MRINYDRQAEIYRRLRDDATSPISAVTTDTGSIPPTTGQWRQERILAPLHPLITKGHHWLTIGDGNRASEARWLQQNGVNAHATDLATDLLELVHHQGLISSYSKENAEHLSFADESFDFVLIKEAFHHFPRPWLALYEAFRVCRHGVVLFEPNGEHPRLLSTIIRLIRRQPSTTYYRFEDVGNFVYAPSPIELEKFLLGLGGHQIALRLYNDHWHSAEADASPSSRGTAHQAKLRRSVQRTIRYRNWMSRTGLVPFGKVGAVLFKQATDQYTYSSLQQQGWIVKRLPINPYASK